MKKIDDELYVILNKLVSNIEPILKCVNPDISKEGTSEYIYEKVIITKSCLKKLKFIIDNHSKKRN